MRSILAHDGVLSVPAGMSVPRGVVALAPGGSVSHPKNTLIERAKKLGLEKPEFVTDKTGPEHEPHFQTQVRLADQVIGRGEGTSKRAAEAAAATAALPNLEAKREGAPQGARKAAAKPTTARSKRKPEPTATTTTEPAEDKPVRGKAAKAKAAAAAAEPATPKPSEPATRAAASAAPAAPTAAVAPGAADAAEDEPFDGPWPMFDDLLAAVLQVADRRVSNELRGDAALVAVRDFSLKLYKELLSDLGEIAEDDEDEEEDEED